MSDFTIICTVRDCEYNNDDACGAVSVRINPAVVVMRKDEDDGGMCSTYRLAKRVIEQRNENLRLMFEAHAKAKGGE